MNVHISVYKISLHSSYLSIWISSYLSIWISSYLSIWISSYLYIWISSYLSIWISYMPSHLSIKGSTLAYLTYLSASYRELTKNCRLLNPGYKKARFFSAILMFLRLFGFWPMAYLMLCNIYFHITFFLI